MFERDRNIPISFISSPYIIQKLTIVVGEPIDLRSVLPVSESGKNLMNAVVLRRQVTELVQLKLYELKNQAESLHNEWIVRSPVAYRTL